MDITSKLQKKPIGTVFLILLLITLPLILLAVRNRQDIKKSAAQTASVAPAGYTLVWEDEFEGTALDTSKWNYFLGEGETPDLKYVREALSVANGNVTLTTYTENGNHYTGWITTENKYHPQYGYLEAKINFTPTENNVLMGFWLFNPLVNVYGDPWNHGLELDIVEHYKTDWQGNDVSDQVTSNLNWGQYGADWDNHPNLTSGIRGQGLRTGYHTYAVLWTPTSQKYYIDGQYLWEVNDSSVTPVSRRDEFFVLSQHPTGGPVNYGTKSGSTVKMNVDYIKVFQLNPPVPPPPTNVRRSGGVGNTTFTWDVSANATSYSVKRATASGGPFVSVGTTKELTYTDTTGVTTQTYFYVITALNLTGESADSSEIKVSPNIALGKPVSAATSKQPAQAATDSNSTSFWESEWATDPQWIAVDLQTQSTINGVILNWEHAYAKAYRIEASLDQAAWTSLYTTDSGDGGIDEISFSPTTARYIRMYGTQRAHTYANPSPFGYAIKEFEVYTSSRAPQPTNLKGFPNDQRVQLTWDKTPGASHYIIKRASQNGGPYTTVSNNVTDSNFVDTGLTNGTTYYYVVRAVNVAGESANSNEVRITPHANLAFWQQTYASSKENADTRPYKAVDGKTETTAGISTIWSSEATSPQWIVLDLQTSYQLNKVILNWDKYAKAYDIQISLDQVNWITVYTTTTGDGGTDTIPFSPVNARYVRMFAREPGTPGSYSLKEFEVYAPLYIPLPSPTASPTPTTQVEPSVTLSPTPGVLCPEKSQGDANCDTDTSLVDFEIWRREFTQEITTKLADFNSDADVGIIDFEIWRREYFRLVDQPPTTN